MNRSMIRSEMTGTTNYRSMAVGNSLYTDYDFIQTINGDGVSSTIEFTSIPQDYKHLQVRYTAKSTGTNTTLQLTLNNGSSYSYTTFSTSGTSSTVANTAQSQSNISFTSAMTNSSTAGSVGSGIIDILDYSSSKIKTIKGVLGILDTADVFRIITASHGITNSVSTLSFRSATNSFGTLSSFSLYGIRG